MSRRDIRQVEVGQGEPKASSLASTVDFRDELYHENLGLQNRPQPSAHPLPAPGTFSLLYESRDGRLCLFEDKDGHITAVRSDRFV